MKRVFHLLLILTFALLTGIGLAQQGTTVLTDVHGPMGLMVDDAGNLWVIDSGFGGDESIEVLDPQAGEAIQTGYGDSAQVIRVAPDGTATLVTHLPSLDLGQEMVGGARLAMHAGSVYATMGFWIEGTDADPGPVTASVVRIDGDDVVRVADLWAFEKEHNPDGFVVEAHPYGLAVGPDGALWVADAGANNLLRVHPDTGEVELIAVFDGVPGPMPNPNRGGAMESDPVPTGIAVSDDGTAYVALLPGFPFIPGSAKVVTVSTAGEIADYATGLTMLTDLAIAPDGALYAVQLWVFTEQGPAPESGAVVRIRDGEATEVLSGLSMPTAIAFNQDGDAFVTVNGAGGPGGAVVRYDGLAAAGN